MNGPGQRTWAFIGEGDCLPTCTLHKRLICIAVSMKLDPNPHLAFGHGAHRCLGAALARVELQSYLSTLLARLPGLRLAVPAEELVWREGSLLRTLRELPVRW